MLDDRPIVQKVLIGAAAFSFVFTAAMAGSAFMISGGFGFGSDAPARSERADYVRVVQQSWDDWAPPAFAATRSVNSEALTDTAQIEPAYFSTEDLAGQSDGRDAAPAYTHSEEELTQAIARDYAQSSEPVYEPSVYEDEADAYPEDAYYAADEDAYANDYAETVGVAKKPASDDGYY